ncbi:unnamed protein product [Phytophthora lilii]|uniref:Unnamed protein product n=1 Tax=Phytophthora lilii TaxID=2077276 RepID=A0A9W6TFF5_9STRA|nr:unnamed protein product [Phytophthora lilii]
MNKQELLDESLQWRKLVESELPPSISDVDLRTCQSQPQYPQSARFATRHHTSLCIEPWSAFPTTVHVQSSVWSNTTTEIYIRRNAYHGMYGPIFGASSLENLNFVGKVNRDEQMDPNCTATAFRLRVLQVLCFVIAGLVTKGF